jgi:hypothetical protein
MDFMVSFPEVMKKYSGHSGSVELRLLGRVQTRCNKKKRDASTFLKKPKIIQVADFSGFFCDKFGKSPTRWGKK